MQSATNLFDVVFDAKKSERRVANETIAIIKKILINSGMDEGSWIIRDAHRIKKKGPEKFRVIRVESRGGVKSIRFWCKPRGNDTCYEYTLIPPAGVDVGQLFVILGRANPISLNIPESIELPGAFFNHILDAPPRMIKPIVVPTVVIDEKPEEKQKEIEFENKQISSNLIPAIPPIPPIPVVESCDKSCDKSCDNGGYEIGTVMTGANVALSDGRGVIPSSDVDQSEVRQIVLDICNEFETIDERIRAWKERAPRGNAPLLAGKTVPLLAPLFHPRPLPQSQRPVGTLPGLAVVDSGKFTSLKLTEDTLLSDQEALDRALIAIAYTSEEGFARRVDASDSIILNLGLTEFIENISKEYISIPGAMRALTMALRKSNYIDRVPYSSQDGKISEGVRGYKLTKKAEKRIFDLKKVFDESIFRFPSNWSRGCNPFVESNNINLEQDKTESVDLEQDETENVVVLSEVEEKEASETEIEIENLTEDHFAKLKALLADHENATNQIKEVDQILENLNSEKIEIQEHVDRFILSEKELLKKLEELSKEKIYLELERNKKENKIKQKDQEIEDWSKFQTQYASEKAEVEEEISKITGRKRK